MNAIEVESLTKRYLLGGIRNNSLRDSVMDFFRRTAPSEKSEILALDNVSFNVEEGETLGIIGRNGAGKSTLLKILSRITKPTFGEAIIKGRVGSLLEVGTGFHQELTGRENVYLNGAILGMKRNQIEKKFDEIVSFAEVEKFIDTPVKFYSSGMFMRLAFSVAAHLEPDILIVDEVLAVGDTNFQNKSLDKMQSIMREGRTILFVSHNMSAVMRLCTRAIALNKGQIVEAGNVQSVINNYLSSDRNLSPEKTWEKDAPQNEVVRLNQVRIVNENGETSSVIEMHQPIGIEIEYEVLKPDYILIPNFHIYNNERLPLFAVQDVTGEWKKNCRNQGKYKTTAWLPPNLFNEGNILVEIAISSHIPENRVHLRTDEVVSFEITENPNHNYTRGDFMGSFPGALRPLATWETTRY